MGFTNVLVIISLLLEAAALAVVWFSMQRNDGEVVARDAKRAVLVAGAGLVLLLVATLMGSF